MKKVETKLSKLIVVMVVAMSMCLSLVVEAPAWACEVTPSQCNFKTSYFCPINVISGTSKVFPITAINNDTSAVKLQNDNPNCTNDEFEVPANGEPIEFTVYCESGQSQIELLALANGNKQVKSTNSCL